MFDCYKSKVDNSVKFLRYGTNKEIQRIHEIHL